MFDVGLSEFEAFQAALDDLVDVDPVGLSDGQVHRQLLELFREQSRLEALTLRFAASWDARRVWAENGSKAADARLARDVKLRRVTAARVMRRARALVSMPLTAAALAEGAITTDHVDVLMHANAQSRFRCIRFALDEHQLVGYCRQMSFFEADRAIRNWINVVDAALDDDGPEPAYRDREASWHPGLNGDVHLTAIFDPVGGAMFVEALERIEHDLYLDDQRCGSDRTDRQRKADALVEMARRAVAAPPHARQPRPLVSVVMGDWSFRHLCELSNGTIINPRALVPYLSQTDVEGVLFDGPFHGVGVSTQRTFTGTLRKIIQIRDRHCQHESGCDTPWSKCDVDHIVPWVDGGVRPGQRATPMPTPEPQRRPARPGTDQHHRLRRRPDHPQDPSPTRSGTPTNASRVGNVCRRNQLNHWPRLDVAARDVWTHQVRRRGVEHRHAGNGFRDP